MGPFERRIEEYVGQVKIICIYDYLCIHMHVYTDMMGLGFRVWALGGGGKHISYGLAFSG